MPAFFDPVAQTWGAPTTLGNIENTTSYNRVVAMNSNGIAVAGWITVTNAFPNNSTGYVSYYDGTSWQTPQAVTGLVPAPDKIRTDVIDVAINNNNHALAVWASTQFTSHRI